MNRTPHSEAEVLLALRQLPTCPDCGQDEDDHDDDACRAVIQDAADYGNERAMSARMNGDW